MDLAGTYGAHPLSSTSAVISPSVQFRRLVSRSKTSRPIGCLPGWVHAADCPQSTCDKLDHILSAGLHTTHYKLQSTTPYAAASRPTSARIQYLDRKGYMHVSTTTIHLVYQPIHHSPFQPVHVHPCLQRRGLAWRLCHRRACQPPPIISLPLPAASCIAPGSWLLASAEPHLPCTGYISTRPSNDSQHQH